MCSSKHLNFINLTEDLYSYSSSSVALKICCQADCQSWLLTAACWCLTCLLSETHSLICVALFNSETSVLLFLRVGWDSFSATGSCYSSSKAGRLFTPSLRILNRYLLYTAILIIITYPDLHICFYKEQKMRASFFFFNQWKLSYKAVSFFCHL